MPENGLTRRAFAAGLSASSAPARWIVVRVNLLLDAGAHSAKGLTEAEVALYWRYQKSVDAEFAASRIRFEVLKTDGAFVRVQGYSEIPYRFLQRGMINLFVTESLGYDVDRDRTGGSSKGPHAPIPGYGGDPFYKTFLGLRDAKPDTLAHEYAHHLTLDTKARPTAAGNFWADLRNDFWLWRQRRGAWVEGFRACAGQEWARLE